MGLRPQDRSRYGPLNSLPLPEEKRCLTTYHVKLSRSRKFALLDCRRMEHMPEIALTRPQPSAVVVVPINSGHIYALHFPIEEPQCDVHGQSLRLLFADDAVLVLEGFFSAAVLDTLYMRLEDGSLLLGKDIAQIFLMDPQKLISGSGLDLLPEENLSDLLDTLAPQAHTGSSDPPAPAPEASLPVFTPLATAPSPPFPAAVSEAATMEHYLLSLFPS